MNRRQFLYSGLFAASTTLAPHFAAAQLSGPGANVIMIGGGLAGLVAAYEMNNWDPACRS